MFFGRCGGVEVLVAAGSCRGGETLFGEASRLIDTMASKAGSHP